MSPIPMYVGGQHPTNLLDSRTEDFPDVSQLRSRHSRRSDVVTIQWLPEAGDCLSPACDRNPNSLTSSASRSSTRSPRPPTVDTQKKRAGS